MFDPVTRAGKMYADVVPAELLGHETKPRDAAAGCASWQRTKRSRSARLLAEQKKLESSAAKNWFARTPEERAHILQKLGEQADAWWAAQERRRKQAERKAVSVPPPGGADDLVLEEEVAENNNGATQAASVLDTMDASLRRAAPWHLIQRKAELGKRYLGPKRGFQDAEGVLPTRLKVEAKRLLLHAEDAVRAELNSSG